MFSLIYTKICRKGFTQRGLFFYDIPFQERKKLPEHAIESQRLLRQFTICNCVLLNLFSGPPGFDSGPNPKGSLLACPFIRTTAPVESPEGAVVLLAFQAAAFVPRRIFFVFAFSRLPLWEFYKNSFRSAVSLAGRHSARKMSAPPSRTNATNGYQDQPTKFR